MRIWIFIFVAALAHANPPDAKVKFSKDLGHGMTVKVTVSSERGADRFTVFQDGKETSCTYMRSEELSFFIDVSQVTLEHYPHPLLVSQWSLGAHGEKLVVFDPSLKKNCLLTSMDYEDQVIFEVQGDHITVIQEIEAKNRDGAKEQTTIWKPLKN